MKSDAKSVHTALVEHFVDYNRFSSAIAPRTGTASATVTQVTINVTNPKKPGCTCSITARPSGTVKQVCS